MWARFKDHCDYDYRCACASLNTTMNTKDRLGLKRAVATNTAPVRILQQPFRLRGVGGGIKPRPLAGAILRQPFRLRFRVAPIPLVYNNM
jgi:hypothetical protein